MTDDARIGFYVCHCGTNIADTVDVEEVAQFVGDLPNVVVSRDYQFMCSEPGQNLIGEDILAQGLNRVVVAACSPMMHEMTFRGACANAGLNPYLFQMANIREHCAWIHENRAEATTKARALCSAAVGRVVYQEPLEISTAPIHPDTLVIGAGIAGIQAALDLAESGNEVYLVEKGSTIGGNMARFDKTFPTLDCRVVHSDPEDGLGRSPRKHPHLDPERRRGSDGLCRQLPGEGSQTSSLRDRCLHVVSGLRRRVPGHGSQSVRSRTAAADRYPQGLSSGSSQHISDRQAGTASLLPSLPDRSGSGRVRSSHRQRAIRRGGQTHPQT